MLRLIGLGAAAVLLVVVGLWRVPNSQGAIVRHLSGREMSSMLGGLCDIDCETRTTGCSTRPPCDSHDDCEPYFWEVLCTDTTKDETCTKVTTFGFDCVVDPPHQCWPYIVADGTCNLLLQLCSVEGNQGNCPDTASQCHY